MHHRMRTWMLLLVIALFANTVAAAAPVQQDPRFATPVVIVNSSFLNVRTGPGVEYTILVTVVGGTSLQVMGIAPDGVWYQVSTVVGLGWVNSQYTLPRGNFEHVPTVRPPQVVEAAAATSFSGAVNNIDDTAVDMGFSTQRLWGASVTQAWPVLLTPSTNALKVLDIGASDGIIYRIVNATFAEGMSWVQLEFNQSVVGWIDQTKLRFRPYGCGFSVVQMTRDFIMRKGPDGSGTDGEGISEGHEAYLLDRVGNLFKIELQNGVVGWVEGEALLIRDEASVTAPECIGAASIGGIGTEAGDQETAQVVPQFTTPYVIVNTGFLNIRSGAGVQFTPVATVPGGTRLAVIGVAPDFVWYLVEGTFGRGWLNIEFVIFRGDGRRLPIIRETVGSVASPVGRFTGGALTIYAAPNLTLGVVGTIAGPVEVSVIGRTTDFNWVQISTPIGNGWVQRDFLTIVGDTALIPVINR